MDLVFVPIMVIIMKPLHHSSYNNFARQQYTAYIIVHIVQLHLVDDIYTLQVDAINRCEPLQDQNAIQIYIIYK